MELPSLSQIETFASAIVTGGVLGVDIGTSSAKVVQIAIEAGRPVLQTYGEIDLGPYGDREARRIAHLTPKQQSAALQDLMHDVEATARKGGVAIPLSSVLISLIRTPRRDREQMGKLIAADAQRYIPMPIESVVIDWLVVGGEEPQDDAFARAESKEPAKPHTQEVMIVALPKDTIHSYEMTAADAGIMVSFYEIDIFSAARACEETQGGCALLLDLGASNAKMAVINNRGATLAAHVIAGGGEKITQGIMKVCGWSFEKAEQAKRERGFGTRGEYTGKEHAQMDGALREEFELIGAETSRFLEDVANKHDIDVTHVILCGGGALMPGIAEHAARVFGKTVKLSEPFSRMQVPMILEDVLKEVGPKFTTAVGLALRGVRS